MRARFAAVILLIFGVSVQAQEAPPDVAIIAFVRAKEVRFSVVPNVTVRFAGANAKNVHETDRQNLPEKVEPYVTYRDVGIRLTITTTLPEIEKILDEALGPQPKKP